MKKKEARSKLHLKNKFLKQIRRRIRKKRHRTTHSKPRNPDLNRIENIHRKYRQHKHLYVPGLRRKKETVRHKRVVAPKIFSFIYNTDEILEFLQKARKHFSKNHGVEFDLSSIEKITPEAITLFIANFTNLDFTNGQSARGINPSRPEVAKMFQDSGFYNYVSSSVKTPDTAKHFLIHKVTQKKVENEIAKEVCLRAVKNTFKNEKKFRPIYEILIECMANTHNHADTTSQGKYQWWLFEHNDTSNNITSFTFLDLGVGIFKSLPVTSFVRSMTDILNITSNVQLVDKLFAGEISSKTGLKERGKGLPLIFQQSKNPSIRNFIIISNDVKTNLETGEKVKLIYNFTGTFLYWELHPNIKNK